MFPHTNNFFFLALVQWPKWGRQKDQRWETHENPVSWIGGIQLGDITAAIYILIYPNDTLFALTWSYFNENSMLHVCLSFLVLLLFVHLFLLFVFRPIGENSFCQRDIVIFLLRPPSRKESHDDASGSCVAKIERAAYNSARFIYFLLAEFYTHPLSFHLISFFSGSLSFSLSRFLAAKSYYTFWRDPMQSLSPFPL